MNKIIKISLLLSAVGFLFFAGCKKNKPPETPDKPSGPTIIRKNTMGDYTTKSNDPNKDDEIRYIFDWGDGNLDTTRYFLNDSMADTTHAWLGTGKYQIRVRAQDNKNLFSKEWSDTLGVLVVLNRAPNHPTTPTGPSSGLPNIQYTFKTMVVDPDTDSIAVKFDWGNGRTPIWSTFHQSGDSIQDTITFSDTGTFSIKVKAKDINNDSSDWSNAFQFLVTTLNQPPNKPLTPIGPSYILPNVQYTFKTVVSDPDNDSVSAKFEWGNSRTPTWTNFYASGDTISDTVIYSDTGIYSIRTIAKDIHGDSSDWSEALLITVSRNLPPNVPEILYTPESTYTGATLAIHLATTDPEQDRVYYIVDWGDGIVDTFPEMGQEPYNSGDTISVLHIYYKWSPPRLPEFRYFPIKATAKDERGNIQQNWSTPETIKVIYNDETNRPEIFEKNERGAINTRQTFMATAIDPEGDSIAIHFSFFLPGIWTRFRPSGDTLYADAVWPTPGTKQVWAIAKDKKGSISISSETLNFEVIEEGYVKGVFQATTRPDQGELDTVGMQSSPAIASVGGIEKIFIGSEGGQLYCITASDMRREYYKYPDVEEPFDEEPWGNSAAVNLSAGHFYIANDQGEIYCWTLAGQEVWRYPNAPVNAFTHWSFTDAAFSNGYIYTVNKTRDSLYVFSDLSETKVGYFHGHHLTTAPTVDAQGNVYIGDDSGYVYKLPATGNPMTPIWKHKLIGTISTSAIIDASGTIYVGANVQLNGYLYALNPDSTIKWTYTIGEYIFSPPVIGTDNNIYFCDNSGRVHAVDASTGILKPGWSLVNLGSSGSSLAFAADGYFYILIEEEHVFCINSINGTVRWETKLPVAAKKNHQGLKRENLLPSPVIGVDGDIYVAAGMNEIGLYRIQGRNSGVPAYTAWPMFRHDRNHSGKAGFVPNR